MWASTGREANEMPFLPLDKLQRDAGEQRQAGQRCIHRRLGEMDVKPNLIQTRTTHTAARFSHVSGTYPDPDHRQQV